MDGEDRRDIHVYDIGKPRLRSSRPQPPQEDRRTEERRLREEAMEKEIATRRSNPH